MLAICQICKSEFKVRPYLIKKGFGKYCSWECRYGKKEERFFNSIEKEQKINGCWLWTKAIGKNGYGVLNIKGILFYAHRYSWELNYGKIPKNMFICHKCDVRNCVNPKHLFLGTNHDNVKDMIRKGRNNSPKGSNSPKAKLTEEDVIKIKNLLKTEKTADLAKLFNIGKRQIIYIKNNQSWKHVKV